MGVKNTFFAIALLLILSVVLGKGSRKLQQCPPSVDVVPIYRYWNGVEHFYTANAAEIGTTVGGQKGRHGYVSEGIAFHAVPA
jgi:Repeat of unknown function (DUF5648)